IVDVNNSTGLRKGTESPLVCIYSSAGGQSKESQGKPFTQCLSYSLDRGQTFTKYEHNPVLGYIEGSNRDPKVFWHEPSKQWIMSLILVDQLHKFILLGSPDLKKWTRYSDIIMKEGVDCPDLFELPVNDDKGRKKWVFQVGNGEYSIGSFDGKTFKPESEIITGNYGNSFYAAQTWNNIPADDGRRIQIAWMKYTTPGMPFNGATTFPCELSLKTTEEGIRLFAEPAKEIELLHEKEYQWKEEIITEGKNLLDGITGDLFDIRAELDVKNAESAGLIIRGIPVAYDIARQELTCMNKKAPLKTEKGKIYLQILVDRSSFEIFANHGRVYMPIGVTPEDRERSLVLFSKGGESKAESLKVFQMKSFWINN
ncbi:MAG: glycoside hydrolase family 32 protein, partial [Bacteroidota bacterium]